MAFCGHSNLAMFELVYERYNQVMENTLYFVLPFDDWDATSLQEHAEYLGAWWTDNLAPQTSNSVTLALIRGRDLGAIDSYVIEYTPETGNVGELTSPGEPGNVTLAIKFGTGFAGRAKRGRNYFVGLTEAQVVGNEILDAERDAIVTAYMQLIATEPTQPIHVVFSRKNCTDIIDTGDVYPVISYTADGFIDSQRRRLAGRGS